MDIPQEWCPYCGDEVFADWADVGVGWVQAGPFHCPECQASQIGPYDDLTGRADIDEENRWYLPNSPAGSTANTDDVGNIIGHQEADALYRAKQGIAPRRIL